MNEGFYSILKQNLNRVQRQAAVAAEKAFAHLYETAELLTASILKETGEDEILRAVLHSDDASRIYREVLSAEQLSFDFDWANKREEPYFSRLTERSSRLYLCGKIASHSAYQMPAELFPLMLNGAAESIAKGDRKVAFLRNRQTFHAFERFAKTLGGVSVLYENNFGDACEAVETGQAAYAIVPIYSTSDGRLNSFYRIIEKHELSIILTCDVDSDDGESMTTFALIHKEHLIPSVGAPHLECQITFDELSSLSDITDAAYYFGATVTGLEALPVMFSGRAGTFAVIFDLSQADVAGLVIYLALEYPQMSVVGMYGKV